MNHHLESLGWTLVHFCWQAAAIALVYWFADAVLSKARSQTRYVLALGTMLLMLSSAWQRSLMRRHGVTPGRHLRRAPFRLPQWRRSDRRSPLRLHR